MKSIVFDDVSIQQMFGHEAAEDEDPNRLRSYYFKNNIYERMTANLPLRILVGHKGIGKSALLNMSKLQDEENGILSLMIRPDDVSAIDTNSDMLANIRNWKEGLLKIIYEKCLAKLGLEENKDGNIFQRGVNIVAVIFSVFKPAINEVISIDLAKKQVAKSILNNSNIRIYIDDLDRGWTASQSSITRLSALINAARDLTKEHNGLQFRISLRTDVYYLVRTSDESTDKIESSVVWHTWTNHEILAMLTKRVQAFMGNQFSEVQLVKMDQSNLASLLYDIMEPRHSGRGKWVSIPTHRMLMTLIRRRPRDLVKLCTLAAQSASSRRSAIINTQDFESIFDIYSQGRLQDTINEYKSELPDIKSLLLSMKPSRDKKRHGSPFQFTTAELTQKIKNIQSMQSQYRFFNNNIATDKDLIAFLYKINFLTARKQSDNKITRLFFEENQYISSQYIDFGFDWEVHPAYRWALMPGDGKAVSENIEDYEL